MTNTAELVSPEEHGNDGSTPSILEGIVEKALIGEGDKSTEQNFDPSHIVSALVLEQIRDTPAYDKLKFDISPTGFIAKSALENTPADRFRSVARALRDLPFKVFPFTDKEPTPMVISMRSADYMAREVRIGGVKVRRDDAVPLTDLLNAFTFALRQKNDPSVQAVDQAEAMYSDSLTEQDKADLRYQILLATHRDKVKYVVDRYIEILKQQDQPQSYID